MNKHIYMRNNISINTNELLNMNSSEILDVDKFELYNYLNDNPNITVYSEKLFNEFKKISKIKDYEDIPVLIQGETGTGKEVLSSYIATGVRNKTFIGLNCSNLSRELFESELFGYEKGSFTGASSTGKEGKLFEARGGVLFLDEFTEIPLDMQSKLLRVLQEREYYKVGGSKCEKVEARFVFASNKNVGDLVKKGLFRDDLYYRINLCEVTIPPLRERTDEIIPLTISFIRQIAKDYKKVISKIEAGVLQKLFNYKFPGNIRELRNIVTKMIIFEDQDIISVNKLRIFDSNNNKGDFIGNNLLNISNINIQIPDTPFNLDDVEKEIVRIVIKKFDGNKTKASRFLGLNRIQMYGRFKNI